jgi:ferric-dicitrate binding protein FerR (iron transport regulator)
MGSLLSGFFNDTLSTDELNALYNLVSDELNKDEIVEWMRLKWEQSSSYENVDGDAMFLQIMDRIRSMDLRKSYCPKRRLSELTRYAAIFVAAFVLSLLTIKRTGTGIDMDNPVSTIVELSYVEVAAPLDSTTMVMLEDGTRIWLNAGAKLKYPACFADNRREVFLLGEGFFDVAIDRHRIFIVKTGGMNIKVVGTKFNVRANIDDNRIEISLIEGAIEALGLKNSRQDGNPVLKPGQRLILQKDSEVFSIVDNVVPETLFVPKEVAALTKVRYSGMVERQTFAQSVSIFGKSTSGYFDVGQNKVILTKP